MQRRGWEVLFPYLQAVVSLVVLAYRSDVAAVTRHSHNVVMVQVRKPSPYAGLSVFVTRGGHGLSMYTPAR